MCCTKECAIRTAIKAYEVGFDYNPNSVSINEDQLFTEGTHFTGPGHYFITFIKNLRTIQFGNQKQGSSQPDKFNLALYNMLLILAFPHDHLQIQYIYYYDKLVDALVSRTQDALLVNIECSFQYTLSIDRADLLSLYKNWGDKYEDAFIAAARNILRDVMAEFDALLTEKLLLDYKVVTQSFQLLDIDLPGNFSQALIDTENLNLNVQTVTYQKEQEIGKAAGRINKAQQDASVIINHADAYSSKVVGEGLSKAGSIKAKFSEQSNVLADLKNSLGMSQKQLPAYYFYEMLDTNKFHSTSMNLQFYLFITQKW